MMREKAINVADGCVCVFFFFLRVYMQRVMHDVKNRNERGNACVVTLSHHP